MNTDVQRSSATPLGATTMTTPAGKAALGKERPIFEHEDGEHIAAIQALADDNIARYGLAVENAKEANS